MDTRNTYEVMFETGDGRIWNVKVRADGMDDRGDVIVFWYNNILYRRTAHIISKDKLISVIGNKLNT